MTTFLQEVARDLYDRYGERLAERELLFPSRRARLFFAEALSEVVDRPLWQPRQTSIDELMEEIAGLKTGDRLRLVTELYKVYSSFHDEPFDRFYFWGDLLLSDFDMIDKYRIDARQLFTNIFELKELEADLSYLTPEQLSIIRHFWNVVDDATSLTAEKERFLRIWRTLLPIYEAFRERLTDLGIAYNGLVQRVAADRLDRGSFTFDRPRRFVVAGFNALTACERRLFHYLQTAAETDFYWDSDNYYTAHPEQEAGMFLRENIRAFPPRCATTNDAMQRPKELAAVATVSNAVQCKYVATILDEWMREGRLDKETAIVLTDENLLMPLLYALPKELGKVNVTMGYPLRQTIAYTLIERLIELQAHGRRQGEEWVFYHADVTGLLAHPLVTECDPQRIAALQEQIITERRITLPVTRFAEEHPLLRQIFRPVDGWQAFSAWLVEVVAEVARIPYAGEDAARRREFLAVTSEEITKLRNSLLDCTLEPSVEVYTSLLRRHLQTLRIPFEGEPLEGVQVMGILETRALDFKNVVILSMTDANFPGNHLSQPSFIPYNLRAAYSLPTPEHHEGVYAYYFYRLIQRAERVRMLYCSRADERSTGEQSRYIRQLDYESGIPIRKIEVGVDVNLEQECPIEIEKSDEVMRALNRFVDPRHPATLSPTALYRYVACPLRFYFHSVARLKADDELTEELDAPMFGTILHAAAQSLYRRIEGEMHPAEALQAMVRAGEVKHAVVEAIKEHYLRRSSATEADFTGNLLLVRDIVVRYLQNGVIKYDTKNDAFMVEHEGCEMDVKYDFPFVAQGRRMAMQFAGIADRVDRLESGALRVVDYKTGSPHLQFEGIERLFNGSADDRQPNILQTLLYAMMLHHTRQCEVVPSLYYVRQMYQTEYSPLFYDKERGERGVLYSTYAEPFEQLLRETLAELYDPSIPFYACDDRKSCSYCDFRVLCKR